MTKALRQTELYLNGDIPVVQVDGEWDESTGVRVTELITGLAKAGHFEIIVNLSRMTRSSLLECRWVDVLDRIASTMRGHFGNVSVVGTIEQTRLYLCKQARTRLFWAGSEEEAIGQIKGLPVFHSGPILTSRLSAQ